MSPRFDIERPPDGLLCSVPNRKPSVTLGFAHEKRAILIRSVTTEAVVSFAIVNSFSRIITGGFSELWDLFSIYSSHKSPKFDIEGHQMV
jgi:hypothetical protein